MESSELLHLTADIVSAHVGHNSVAVEGMASLVQRVHASLAGIAGLAWAAGCRTSMKALRPI